MARTMTDPLIDRDALVRTLYLSQPPGQQSWHECGRTADATMSYLRKVLTPEALNVSDAEIDAWWLTIGANLHRRIFGEDK